MKLIHAITIAILALGVYADDFRVAADGGRAEIQRAIDAAAAAGGGRVVVAPGVHPIGTLRLRSHVELHLEEGAVLLGSTKREDYADFPRDVCSVSPESSYKVLIQAWDAEGIAITGKGTIDGQGPAFYDRKPSRGHWPKPKFRPLMIQFVRCKDVKLKGVTFKDSPMWTMFIRLCEDVTVDGIRIVGDQRMINNDGIDFDSCRRVRVVNSSFKTGDDCIILRAMRERQDEHVVCEDFVASNCVLNSTCQAIRMGAPSDDTIRNARFMNIKMAGNNGIFFDYPTRYTRPYDEGYMDISDIVFDGFEGGSYGSSVQIVAEPGIKIRGVRDVTFRNFNVKCAKPLRFVGNHDSVLTNIRLENFKAEVKASTPFEAVATEPLTFRNCTFNGAKMQDGDIVTPRGERKPFIRSKGKSWETLNQSDDKPKLEEVIIVTKCHLDVGYTHTVPELIERYRTVYMDRALALFDSDRAMPSDLRARWTMPAWLVDAILKGQYAPERRAKIEDAVRQRRLMWHALPFTSEPETSDLEELVRMFSYGSNLSRRFGFDLPRYAKQTDVPEYAWVMPTLLAHAGVKFLQMGINPCSKSKAVVAKIPPLCWWEGPGGSRILLGFSPQYGWWGQRGSVTPPKGWRHKTWLAYYMKGDNAGPMSRKEVDDILRQAREKLPGVKVRFGDPAEFADAIIAEEKANPTLPVVRGDMPDTWIHGMMSLPETTAIHRRTTGDLVTLGQLDTTLRAFGIATEPVAELLDRAYRNSGLYSEHTWGMRGHGVRGPKLFHPDWRARYEAGEYKAFDATFQYHADYARRAHKAVQDGIKARMAALARSVDAEGPHVVVFNPLPYARDAVVEVEMPEGFSLPGGVREGGKVKFLAKGLPAGGYKTFSGIFNRAEHVERVENLHDLHVLHGQAEKLRHFTVKFDLEKGGIASLIENATGRELVKQGGHVLGQFLHERFSRNEVYRYSKVYNERQKNDGLSKPGMPDAAHSPYVAITPSGWRAHMKRSPLGVEVVMTPDDTKGLAKAYELRFTFPDHLPCVDIAWRVEDKTPDPIPEGGWLCLPFNVESPSFRVGRIGGTIDPAKDIIFGANRDILCADRAITVRSGPGGAGVGVASADLPLWSLGRPGLWRYEPDYVPTDPEVFANLYNNQWNTNYPLWIPGSWSASLRVYPVAEGADEEQAIFTPAWEIRQPCVAAFAVGDVFNAETQRSRDGGGVSLSRKGVRVTAFCPNPDGDGIVLRVWEQAGVGGEITVSLPSGMAATEAQPVNLRGERAGNPIPVKDGKFSFELNAWSPKSFVITDVAMKNICQGNSGKIGCRR